MNKKIDKSAQEHLEKFIQIMAKRPLMSKAIEFLTLTQQHESQLVGSIVPQSNINAFYGLVSHSIEEIKVKFLRGNTVMKDFVLYFKTEKGKHKYKIRLVKEIDVRKPDENGKWGINITSLQLIK